MGNVGHEVLLASDRRCSLCVISFVHCTEDIPESSVGPTMKHVSYFLDEVERFLPQSVCRHKTNNRRVNERDNQTWH